MNKVICLRHPKYNGKSSPDLRCKSCCSIFVNNIKELNSTRAENVAAKIKRYGANESITFK